MKNTINRITKKRQQERANNNHVTVKGLFRTYTTKPTGNDRAVARYEASKLCRKLWEREAKAEAEYRHWAMLNRI